MTGAERQIDARGLKCPMPVLKARRALAEMAPGTVLEVLATDPNSPADMADFCAAAGHALEACDTVVQEPAAGQPAFRFAIRRRAA